VKKKTKSYKSKASLTSKVKEPVAALSPKKPLLKVIKGQRLVTSMVDDASILDLIKTSRAGIKYSQFEQLSKVSSLSLDDWSEILHMSTRSLLRYKKVKKAFEPLQSEKILEIALLYEKGSDVFGSIEQFDRWLASKVLAIGGIQPKSLLDSSFGIRMITDQLGRIEHGVLA